jgi:YD repeat-containing protein
MKKTAAGALLLAMNYSLDASGMRTGVEEADASGIVRSVAYAYDATKRLISETIDHRDDANDRIGQWTYDRVGNRLSQTVALQGGSAASHHGLCLRRQRPPALRIRRGQRELQLRRQGQHAPAKPARTGQPVTQYDDANRLIEAITPHAALAYAYTADGLRARQTVTAAAGSPITTQYVQDTAYPYAQVIEEYTAEGANPRQLAATFTFADELISQTRYDATGIPATTFVQADGFGSTRWLTDGTGQITDSIDFDAFGNEIARSGTTDLEHLYRGERWDASLAAYDLRARLYTPSQRKVPDPGQLCRLRQRPTQPAQVRLHPQRPGQRH